LPRFWWVNHKKTFREEVDGGYLWSPKTEISGARSQFYDNLRIARPGDGVISYSNGLIKAIGVVADVAVAAPKPSEFGSRGAQWALDGWLVPVVWQKTQTAARPKDFLAALAPLLPAKYSPLQRDTGHGNQKAYLSEISAEVFNLVATRVGVSLPNEVEWKIKASSSQAFIEEFEAAIESSIRSSTTLTVTEKAQLVLARRGQGAFRRHVSTIEKACRCTGIRAPELLIASHIKPWRYCTDAEERLDGSNGLLLSPNADHLFDRGLMSFDDGGQVIVSSALTKESLAKLGIFTSNVGAFLPTQAPYLRFHRSHILVP
jgi:putative restriction endonuclease